MSSLVIRKMSVGCKGSATVRKIAHKGLFTIMNALVGLQVSLFCEALAAALELADERFFANLFMH